jgi:hypothetical protein
MTRVIRKSRQRASGEAAALLSAVFAAELLAPSRCVWVVSPWISDVKLIDNTADTFDALEVWGPRHVRLSEVLVTLADLGSAIVVGTTEAESNRPFLARVRALFSDRRLDALLTVDVDASNELHEKAITTDDAVIAGSMNITYNGIFVREEFVQLRTDDDFVSRARMDAYDRFGGRL